MVHSYSLSQNSPSLFHYYTEDNGRLPFGSSFMAIYLHPHSDDDEYGFDPGLNLDFPFFFFPDSEYINFPPPEYIINGKICD